MKRSVFLVGLSGSGKTTIGRLLASHLDLPFKDTDEEIQRATGRSIPEIFNNDGEPAFRATERRIVERVMADGPAIVSTGGGVPMDDGSRRAMHAAGTVVWLDAPTDVLVSHLATSDAETRPLLAGDRAAAIERLRSERSFAYAQADLRITTANHSPEQLASMIAHDLEQLAEIDAVWVETPSRTYPVYVGAGALDLTGGRRPPTDEGHRRIIIGSARSTGVPAELQPNFGPRYELLRGLP